MEWTQEIAKSIASASPLAGLLSVIAYHLWAKLQEKEKVIQEKDKLIAELSNGRVNDLKEVIKQLED